MDISNKLKKIYIVLLVVIAAYPLRWTFSGIDLWDVGYSCGNYVNFDTISISKPWFYSTFLSLFTGHLFSMLPYGDILAGLKAYCSLVVSATVFISGYFCIRKLKYPAIPVLIGEAWAVSICYIPGAILYNHLTFLFLILAIIFLYLGLTKEKDILLIPAGAVLALNVFVRISNLPQVLLILAVWYYLFLSKSSPGEYIKKTLVCMAGYFGTGIIVYILIGCRYGFASYVSGIRDMLNISGEAGDYSAGSMMKELMLAYLHGGSRLVYIFVFILAGCFVYLCMSGRGSSDGRSVIATALASAGMLIFMIARKILIFNFYHYATIYYSVAFFLVITIILCIRSMADRTSDKAGRLISFLILLQMLVMSIGSGTGISPIMNSTFLLGPVLFSEIYAIFFKHFSGAFGKDVESKSVTEKARYTGYIRVAAGISAVAICAFVFQALAFGVLYEFEEGGNGAGGRYKVTNNRILSGTRTSAERAEQIQGISDHILEKGLSGHDVLIYGYAPALALYLDLHPVITTWPDLDSYKLSLMEKDLSDIRVRIDSGIQSLPLVIIDEEGSAKQREHNPDKWAMISEFMNRYGYVKDYYNGRFSVYTAGEP